MSRTKCFKCGEIVHEHDTFAIGTFDGFKGLNMPEEVVLCTLCVGFIVRGWVLSERLLTNSVMIAKLEHDKRVGNSVR